MVGRLLESGHMILDVFVQGCLTIVAFKVNIYTIGKSI